MAVTLVTYQDRYGINTITGIINRWAPPSENDTGKYVAAVVKDTGFAADEKLDLHQYADAYKIIRAITIHEQGGFEGVYTKGQLDIGCSKAGLQGVPTGVVGGAVRTATAAAAATSAAAASDPGVLLTVYNSIKPIVDVGPDFLKHAFWGLVALALVGLGVGELIKAKNNK